MFFIILGFSIGELSFCLIGFAFLFVISTDVLLPNQLDVQTGEVKNTSYTYTNATLTSTSETISQTFSNPNTRWYGLWTMIISAVGMAVSSFMFFDNGGDKI